MKFSIAAGLLVAQSLPAASADTAVVAADAFIPPGEGSNHHDLLDPQEILSLVMHSPKLQPLKNKYAQTTSMIKKNCDPSSDDPDVGVLSCGLGYECVPLESSFLEGQCVRSSRDLQTVDFCDLCGFGQIVGYSKFSIPTGYQDFTCGDLSSASYGDNVTLTSEQCYGSAQLVNAAGCCVSYDCDPCGELTFNGNLTFTDILCGSIAPLLNDTACAYYTEYLSKNCCEGEGEMMPATAPASSAVSDIPTPVPVVPETPTADTPEAAAPSGSATIRSTSPFVSMVGFVVVTAGGLLLN